MKNNPQLINFAYAHYSENACTLHMKFSGCLPRDLLITIHKYIQLVYQKIIVLLKSIRKIYFVYGNCIGNETEFVSIMLFRNGDGRNLHE